jgi:DNA-binding MarR family transcriptional regulator
MAKKGTDDRRPSSHVPGPTPFELEFPGSSESANAVLIALIRTAAVVNNLHDEASREHKLSAAGRQLLAVLEGAGEPLSPTDISERLMVTTASITSLVDTLERRKFVKRAPDPDDRRRVLVSITPAGRKVVDRFLPEIVALQTETVASVSEGDRKRLIALLDTIKKRAAEMDATAVRKAAKPRGVPRHG